MNVYDAIMKAADKIETHPELWSYGNIRIPECGSPGCALGWIGVESWANRGESISHVSKNLLGLSGSGDFYDRMSDIKRGWMGCPLKCAATLRAYARKYHAPEKPKGIPAAVREIFEAEVA